MCARVSLADENEEWRQNLLDPIFEQFKKDDWSKVKWIKLVLLVLICNGAAFNLQPSDDDTVQMRLIMLVME